MVMRLACVTRDIRWFATLWLKVEDIVVEMVERAVFKLPPYLC